MARTHLTKNQVSYPWNDANATAFKAKLDDFDTSIDALEGGTTSTVVTIHPVRAASTANVANLASCSTTMDTSITLVAGDRVLLKDQSTATQNGVYVVGTVAGGAAPLTRATDFDASAEVKPNTIVAVSAGTANANTLWALAISAAPTIGSTNLPFVRIGYLSADATGRALMATGFFTEAKATDAFAAQAITGALLKNATVTDTQLAASWATGKHTAVAAAGNTVGAIANMFIVSVADGSTVLDALTLDATYGKIEVDDVFFIKNTVTGGATDAAQLCTDAGGTTPVSTDLALNGIASGGVVRTATITKANAVFAAGAHFYVKRTHTTDCGGTMYVLAHRVA